MIIVQPGQNFGFSYEAFDQNASLKIAFSVYDCSSGSPIFLAKVPASYIGKGNYTANYLAQPGITYCVVGLVYTDSGFTSVDVTRSQYADVFQSSQSTILQAGFVYISYDFSTARFVQASIYNTTGTPTLQASVPMTSVLAGVYYGSFSSNDFSQTFQIIGIVYTDGTYTVPNLNYAPSSANFNVVGLTPIIPTPNFGLLDVSELLYDYNFVDAISVVSRVPSVNALGENIVVESSFNSFGSVQPTVGNNIQRIPQALRNSNVLSFWFRGIITATAFGEYPNILVFQNVRYQVKTIFDWSTWGRGYTEGLCVAEPLS